MWQIEVVLICELIRDYDANIQECDQRREKKENWPIKLYLFNGYFFQITAPAITSAYLLQYYRR